MSKEIYGQDLVDGVQTWTRWAEERIGLGKDVTVGVKKPMRLSYTSPEDYDTVLDNKKQSQDIVDSLRDPDIHRAKIRHDGLRTDQEFRDVIVLEERLRYDCGRRHSIMASANNLDRVARDTKKLFKV